MGGCRLLGGSEGSRWGLPEFEVHLRFTPQEHRTAEFHSLLLRGGALLQENEITAPQNGWLGPSSCLGLVGRARGSRVSLLDEIPPRSNLLFQRPN